MQANNLYFYIYPELLERHELTLFEYSVLEIISFKSTQGTFYGDKDVHLAEVLDSSYDYVCRVVRNLIKKGWLTKIRKGVVDIRYDELEVNSRWAREVNISIEKQNSNPYYRRFQFFPALMTEANMTLKQYVVSLTIDILKTAKTSKIASFAGVCRQTVYNTISKFKDYFEKADTGVKKLTEIFKTMKKTFTEKVVSKEYQQMRRESRNFQREQDRKYRQEQQQAQTQTKQKPQASEAQTEKFIEEEIRRKAQHEREQAVAQEAQRQKNQAYADKVFGSS
jgi:DNA-binding phage protein